MTRVLLFSLLLTPLQAWADACYSRGQELPIINEQVLVWKRATKNQYKSRAHVLGKIVQVYRDRQSHNHFSISLGPRQGDTVELVFNKDFGVLPELQAGDEVEACGDYITANAPTRRYPASPDGALVHWLHRSNSRAHDHGFIVLKGRRYGDAPVRRDDVAVPLGAFVAPPLCQSPAEVSCSVR
ncbi:MAG: DUF3465 domain-containing protein [Elusimicrobia bacterium]|nr:DUF3465 domain-containing protein [Elusimicrobiota bacterium]